MRNRFDGLSLSNDFLPSESFTISEELSFNVINVGLVFVGDVSTNVISKSSVTINLCIPFISVS